MPSDGAENRGDRRHDQDLARADHHTGEDVAAEPIGAEEWSPDGPTSLLRMSSACGFCGAIERTEDGAEDPDAKDDSR